MIFKCKSGFIQSVAFHVSEWKAFFFQSMKILPSSWLRTRCIRKVVYNPRCVCHWMISLKILSSVFSSTPYDLHLCAKPHVYPIWMSAHCYFSSTRAWSIHTILATEAYLEECEAKSSSKNVKKAELISILCLSNDFCYYLQGPGTGSSSVAIRYSEAICNADSSPNEELSKFGAHAWCSPGYPKAEQWQHYVAARNTGTILILILILVLKNKLA